MNVVRPSFKQPGPPVQKAQPSKNNIEVEHQARAQDAVDNSRESGLGIMSKAALVGLGLLATTSAVAQVQQVEASDFEQTEIDLAVEKTAAPKSQQTESQLQSENLDLTIKSNWLGRLGIKGRFGSERVDVDLRDGIFSGHHAKGNFGDEKVNLDVDRTLFGNYELDGNFGSNDVDLEIDKTLWGNHDVTGNWGDAKVDLDFDKDWSGNYDIDGRWNGERVDLDVSRNWRGHTRIKGKFGDQKVDLTTKTGWRGRLEIEGKAPKEAIAPVFLSQYIQSREAASSASPSAVGLHSAPQSTPDMGL